MNRIKELRKERGITQEELTKVLNVQRSTLSKYESESVPLTADTISLLTDYFNVSADYLLGRTDNPSPPNSDDEEIWELRERLRTQPGMRALFSATKDATKEDFLTAVKIIEALKGDSKDGFD